MHLGAMVRNISRTNRVVSVNDLEWDTFEAQSKAMGYSYRSVFVDRRDCPLWLCMAVVVKDPTRVEPWNDTASEFFRGGFLYDLK